MEPLALQVKDNPGMAPEESHGRHRKAEHQVLAEEMVYRIAGRRRLRFQTEGPGQGGMDQGTVVGDIRDRKEEE